MPKMTNTASFSLPEKTLKSLEERTLTGYGESRSARLVLDLDFYWAVLKHGLARAKAKLTRQDGLVLLDLMNSTLFDPGQVWIWLSEPSGLVHNLEDGIRLDGLAAKWDVDEQAILERVKSLTPLETLAILDWTKQAWGHLEEDPQFERALQGFQEE